MTGAEPALPITLPFAYAHSVRNNLTVQFRLHPARAVRCTVILRPPPQGEALLSGCLFYFYVMLFYSTSPCLLFVLLTINRDRRAAGGDLRYSFLIKPLTAACGNLLEKVSAVRRLRSQELRRDSAPEPRWTIFWPRFWGRKRGGRDRSQDGRRAYRR